MAYKRLDEFLIRLEQEGELIRIKTPVSADLEVTEGRNACRLRAGRRPSTGRGQGPGVRFQPAHHEGVRIGA